jgi:glycosyltransferase involved in cell wall biosynthesis
MAVGLEDLGHDVQIWNYGLSPNGFRVDREVNPETPEEYFGVLQEALAEEFDVFHFQTSRTLLPARGGMPQMWELPLLRALSKRVIFSFHGSDIRKVSHHAAEDRWSFYRFADIPCDEEKIDARMSLIRAYAHAMTVSSVLDLVYAPGAVYLPKSLDLSQYRVTPQPGTAPPVVLHATRRRATKGTDIIERELGELSRRFDIEVRIVEGLSHDELLGEISRADIVVEKLLGGDAGVLSLEAMAMGRVAVARIRDEVRERHPEMAVVSANPETFSEVMAELLSSPERRAELGAAGRRYVEAEHSAAAAGTFSRACTTRRSPPLAVSTPTGPPTRPRGGSSTPSRGWRGSR